MTEESEPSGLGTDDVLWLVEILGPELCKGIVLVGGQAINFWAQRYRGQEAVLEQGPFASKDVDFLAPSGPLDVYAQRLSGRIGSRKGRPSFMNGTVEFTDRSGTERLLDFLRYVDGTKDAATVLTSAVPVPVGESELLVMHPLWCLWSRATNVVEHSGQYDNERGVQQLLASIALCWLPPSYVLNLLRYRTSRAAGPRRGL